MVEVGAEVDLAHDPIVEVIAEARALVAHQALVHLCRRRGWLENHQVAQMKMMF